MATDNFNRADGGLGSNWTTCSTNAPQIVSNEFQSTSNGSPNAAYWSADTFTADQFSEAVLINVCDTQGPGVGFTGTPFRGVFVYMVDTTQLVLVGFTAGGSDGNLLTVNGSFSAGDTIRLSRAVNVYTVWKNGSTLSPTLTTASYSGGQPGIQSHFSGARLDDWRGGDGDGAAGVLAMLGAACL